MMSRKINHSESLVHFQRHRGGDLHADRHLRSERHSVAGVGRI